MAVNVTCSGRVVVGDLRFRADSALSDIGSKANSAYSSSNGSSDDSSDGSSGSTSDSNATGNDKDKAGPSSTATSAFTSNLLLTFADDSDSGFASGSALLAGGRWSSPQTTNATTVAAANATQGADAHIIVDNLVTRDHSGNALASESLSIALEASGGATGERLVVNITRKYLRTVEVTAERSPAFVLQPSGSSKGARFSLRRLQRRTG